MIKRIYLVIRADQKVRAVNRSPSLRPDEIAIPVDLRFPQGWGEIRWGSTLAIDVPDLEPAATVREDEARQGEEENEDGD